MLPTESLTLQINVPMKMRDGAILYADIWQPEKREKHPALLIRLPYNKDILPSRTGYLNPQRFARAGYSVAIQDVRGTGSSESTASFWSQESEDGYDSVEWLASQPWCDGSVGMYGISYFGYTQWAAAVARPPHLKTICPGMTDTNPHSFPFSRKGDKFKLQTHLGWCLMMSSLGLLRGQLPTAKLRSLRAELIKLTDGIDEQFGFLPMKDSPAVKKVDELGMVPRYADVLAHMDDSEYWKEVGEQLPLERVSVPVFHLTGWYDVDMTPGVLASYQYLKDKGGSELAREKQKLVVGPWIHSTDLLNLAGQLDFGQASSGAVADVTGMHIRWFNRWLKGIDNGIEREPPIRIFVMGDNSWRDEKEWPLARTQYTRYFFHSGGRANGRRGDGELGTDSPTDEPSDSYLYDPRNPVPSSEFGMGAFDQQDLEDRADVLVYSSAPLETDLEVTGPVRLVLYASTSAVDTDFFGRLIDVWPVGKAYNVAEGIIRARYHRSMSESESVRPGTVYEYSIDLGATSNVFKAGHRIRVEVSSSSFPKWDCNLNTGRPLGQDAEIRLAVQTVYHRDQFASHILLPVIPR